MADEITYIPYGLDEISQLDLYTALANDLPNFVNKYKWLLKPKNLEKFLKAYDDIMQGFAGATNEGGRWRINTNNTINTESMSPKDREIYEHAAYYIQLQMAKMTPRSKMEEAKKEDLTPFNFKESFGKQLLNLYGGDSKLFENPEQGWNSLDARGADGFRGTEKRKETMAKLLDLYKQELANGKDYNFEGTSFKDKQDALTKLLAAIDALRNTPTDESDDLPAFSALGLNYRSFFSNGGNEELTLEDGRKTTYLEYYQELLKKKAEEEKAKFELAKLKLANQYNRYKYYNVSKFNERPLTAAESNIQHLNELVAKDTWDADDSAQIKLFFKLAGENGHLVPLSREELDRFGPTWRNRTLYLRKINGINGVYYDTVSGKYVKPIKDGLTPTTSFLDILNLNNSENIKQKELLDYLNSTKGGFTPAELREVAALLFDLGAAADPEGVTSAGLSQIAAGIRDYNRASDPEGWTWGDTGWATLDHGLGLLSAIPVAGGWLKGAWAAKKLGNYLPKMEKAIRLLGRTGSTYAMAANAPGALDTLNKIKNGEDLSLKDYQDLAYFFIGGLGHHQLNRGNRVERTAMKARGIETSNSILNKAGITSTKAKVNTTETTSTLKIKKTGEDGKVETKEIPIKKEQLEVLRNTRPSEVDAKAKELLGEKIPEGYKVETNTGWRARTLNYAKGLIGKGNSEIFGTPLTSLKELNVKSNEEFEQYLSKHNNTWLKKFFNGSNKDIRRYDKYLGNSNESELVSSAGGDESPYAKKPLEQGEIKYSNTIDGYPNKTNAKESTYRRAIMKRYKNVMEGKFSNKEMENVKEGIKIGNENVRVFNTKDAHGNSLISVYTSQGTLRFKSLEEAKKFIASLVKNLKNNITSGKITKENVKEIGKVLLELKKKGWLKQGGQINSSLDIIIEDFIKNNNI